MIGIIDTGFGNLNAIKNIYLANNINVQSIKNANDLMNIEKIIIPGIGNFDGVIKKLISLKLIEALNTQVIVNKIPILGICIGMQIFFNASEEGNTKGLGWINDKIMRLEHLDQRLPHLGWNSIKIINRGPLFKDITDDSYFYFIHSYGNLKIGENDYNQTITRYGKDFVSSINQSNIYGVQFHPEKSHQNGEKILINFANI